MKVLSVEPKAVINFMYCELGKLPLAVKIKLGVIFLILKLNITDNYCLKACYEDMIVGNDDWTLNIKEKLSKGCLFYSRENMQS